MSSEDAYANARKEMELLIREEAAMSPEDARSRGYIPKKPRPKTGSGLFNTKELEQRPGGKTPMPVTGGVVDPNVSATWIQSVQPTASFAQQLQVASEAELVRAL